MAEQRDLTKILDNVSQELAQGPGTGVPTPARTNQGVVESFAPQKYRNAGDTLSQIQQDFRKSILDLENRFKTLMDEVKRAAS
jgi:hypothetical protein